MPLDVIENRSESLHELNVGNYLNLFEVQETMKIGFIVNESPKDIKVYKSIKMILNTNYSIKNIDITTSSEQSKQILGTHFRYIIREGMHTVPLKNQYDPKDLRGSWAYIEIELESIDNKEIDLFSVITFLRKSML